MKIELSQHSLDKLNKLKLEGWDLSESDIKSAIRNPDSSYIDSLTGVNVSLRAISENLDLRVVFIKVGGIIKVITFHPAKKGRYAKK